MEENAESTQKTEAKVMRRNGLDITLLSTFVVHFHWSIGLLVPDWDQYLRAGNLTQRVSFGKESGKLSKRHKKGQDGNRLGLKGR